MTRLAVEPRIQCKVLELEIITAAWKTAVPEGQQGRQALFAIHHVLDLRPQEGWNSGLTGAASSCLSIQWMERQVGRDGLHGVSGTLDATLMPAELAAAPGS